MQTPAPSSQWSSLGPYPSPCCNFPDALVVISYEEESDEAGTLARIVLQCSTCGRKHYGMSVPPIPFDMQGR